jgi:hypothetical protein
MNYNSRLFVEIHPFEGDYQPHPHPIRDGHFDPALIYKVLGVYNPSETSECYFMIANPQRQIWFIPQRHLLAYRLIDSDEFFLTKAETDSPPVVAAGDLPLGSSRQTRLRREVL